MNGAAGVDAFSVTVEGRRVHCLKQGTGDQVFVLIPGYAADHTTWLFTQPALAAQGRVYAPDLPGTGLSSLDVGGGDIAFFARIVLSLMDHQGIASAHLVGHSMGASIAVELATAARERVSALTLIGPGGIDPWINMTFISGFPRVRSISDARTMMEMLVANPKLISPEALRLVVAYTTTPGVPEALDTIAAASFPGRQAYLYRERIAELGVPTRIVWGAEDAIVRPIATGFPPDVPVHVIPKAGHLVHLEQAPAVNRLILARREAHVSQSRA
ncbi:MAG TPA: alpha/beta fold hydrolase [Bauldia sp.]|nr:alpha/beta fold hydrolase [Bauldia sp.]